MHSHFTKARIKTLKRTKQEETQQRLHHETISHFTLYETRNKSLTRDNCVILASKCIKKQIKSNKKIRGHPHCVQLKKEKM